MKKTVLITGASSGFGLLLANQLQQQGFNVIGTSREPEKHAGKVPFKMLRLDIDDDESIRHFTDQLFAHTQQLDVLVNNAGYMVTGLAEETSVAVGRDQFETNFWGTVKVTNALLPHFRKQKRGQIITVVLHRRPDRPTQPVLLLRIQTRGARVFQIPAVRIDPFNIKVSMVEPVWFKTNLAHNAVAANTGRIADYDAYRKQADAATQKGIDEAEAPDAVVQTITRLIGAKEPRFSNPVGKMTAMILFLQSYLPKMFEGAILKSVKTAA